MTSNTNEVRLGLRGRVICPHCWEEFSPEDILWVSEHPSLRNDVRLGQDEARRFLPDRFDLDGNAIDPGGSTCKRLACPNCHLLVPRANLELQPLFVSIVGSPACGKSYFLASMTWRLRKVLPQVFGLSFADADPMANALLNEYEEQQFHNSDQDALIKLAKTQEQGDLYDEIRIDQQIVRLPRPFFFAIRPSTEHPNREQQVRASRVMCLYDNAGESFQPGKDTTGNQVTGHLTRSDSLLFLYDPTQDTRFREACRGVSQDPQVNESPVTTRQETILHEMTDRIRRHTRLPQHKKHSAQLIVVVTKCDAWKPLLKTDLLHPWRKTLNASIHGLDLGYIKKVSNLVRDLLWKYSPELCSAAESFADDVLYVPTSATGHAPEKLPNGHGYGIRPRKIRPIWAEVPMLAVLCRGCRGMVAHTIGTDQKSSK